MIIWQMMSWWYSSGFLWVISRIKNSLENISQTLAIDILIKTLFSPWKQITSNNLRIGFLQKIIDNSVSRLVGFGVRFFMLIVGAVWATIILIIGFIWLILWPFIPIMIFILPFLTINGVDIS